VNALLADMTHAWAMYILDSSVSLSLTAERVHKAPGGVFISASVLPVLSSVGTESQ
jgi:hypothetical protein